MKMMTRTAAAVVAALGLGLAAPAAFAQDQQMQPQPPAQAQNFSDEQIESFALAALEVQKVQAQYGPMLESAADEQERQQIVDDAIEEMVAAVEAAPGISVDEYNVIAEAVSTNPAVAAQVQETIQQAAGQ